MLRNQHENSKKKKEKKGQDKYTFGHRIYGNIGLAVLLSKFDCLYLAFFRAFLSTKTTCVFKQTFLTFYEATLSTTFRNRNSEIVVAVTRLRCQLITSKVNSARVPKGKFGLFYFVHP